MEVIPLFPLNIVLFPGGPLPLRIFETRYLDMVRRCMRDGQGFGVVLIREGTVSKDLAALAPLESLKRPHPLSKYAASHRDTVAALGAEHLRGALASGLSPMGTDGRPDGSGG